MIYLKIQKENPPLYARGGVALNDSRVRVRWKIMVIYYFYKSIAEEKYKN